MSHAVVELADCTNCGTPLRGTYCSDCGQKARGLDPRLGDLLHEFMHEVLHLDGKIFRTLGLLFARPGFLTKEACAGRDARYVSPLRLYLTFSVLAFGVLALVPQRAVLQTRDISRMRSGITFSAGPQAVVSTGVMTSEQAARLQEETLHMLPRLNLLLVPLCAVLVMLAARKARRHYPQHLYFTLHVHSVYFGLVAATWPLVLAGDAGLNQIGSLARFFGIIGYGAMAFKSVYGGGWFGAVAKTFIVFIAYAVLVVIVWSATALVLFRLGRA